VNVQELIAEILEYLRGMWRYRWWAVACAWAISTVGLLYVYSMPDVYSASARVYVDTKSLMKPIFEGLAISDNVTAQVEAVSRALLTRPNVEAVARRTDLDLRADSPADMERLITSLQERIKVEPNREQNVFSISYQDPDREKAQEVVAAIVDEFVERSLQGQGDDAEMTARALDAEIRDHEERLQKAENDLAQFKKDNLGYMPDDRGDYYARLQAALNAVSETESQLREARNRRDELQRQIGGEEPVFGIMSNVPAGPAAVGCSQQAQIAQLRTELATLRVDFTDKHPSIVSLKEIIAQLETACGEERQAAAKAGVPAVVSPEQPLQANPVYQNLRIQLSNAEVAIAGLQTQLSTNQGAVAQLRADVDKIAEVEAALKQLNRDYGVIQSRYQELLERREKLESKERLDPVTDAVQFRTLEPPFAAFRPIGPNRPIMLIAVLMFAIGAGVAITFGLNQLQPVFFTRRSLQRIGGVPVLGSVSMLLAPDELNRRRRAAYAWVAACASLVVFTILAVVFQSTGAAVLRQLIGGAGA
jgi:polysaccharide chain length determinant protein (PEP-CTERM system associated)